MRKSLRTGVLAFGVFTAGVFTTGCGAADGSTAEPMVVSQVRASPASVETPIPSAPSSVTPAEVELGETAIGEVLVGEGGRTLYLFEKDRDGRSSCYEGCARVWPPYLTDGRPGAGMGVREELLDTAERDDGTTQVTYNGHPLYYFIEDTAAGETNGQDIESFGASWYAVDADGEKAHG